MIGVTGEKEISSSGEDKEENTGDEPIEGEEEEEVEVFGEEEEKDINLEAVNERTTMRRIKEGPYGM
jgi:hypothetical protein